MIELMLQAGAADAPFIQQFVGDRPGMEVAEIDLDQLYQRADVDALILNEWVAAEYFLARPARAKAEVVVDQSPGQSPQQRIWVYEATVSPANNPDAQLQAAASWIVVMPKFAVPPPSQEHEHPSTTVPSAPSAREPHEYVRVDSIDASVRAYPLYLNALEVMERHNAGGHHPLIRRAAIRVDERMMPSVLLAYAVYRERALAGLYGDGRP